MNYFVSRKYFYAIYSIILLVLILLCLSYTKERLFLLVNSNNNIFLDYFFYLLTELGNTITYILIMVISLFYARRFTFMLLLGLLISSVLTEGLKYFIFE